MGRRIDDIAITWCNLFQLNIAPKLLENEIITAVAHLISTKGEAKKGLYELLDYLTVNNFKIALATSSSQPIINAVFERLSIAKYFNVVCSADNEKYGKPHPAIYINTMVKLGVNTIDCLVLEDSVTGLIAAKAASIHTLVIPEDKTDPRFTIADGIYSNMLEIIEFLKN